jgi:lipopolysaccharide export system protein LptC
MTSDKPVLLKIDGGEVAAQSVEFSQKDRHASFAGGVHSVLYGEGDAPSQSSGAATKD